MALTGKRAIGSGKWKKLWLEILARDGYTCGRCYGTATTVDHIWPRSKGGDMWDPLNLMSLCKPCNSGKGNRLFLKKEATPPVFSACSLPETVRTVPDSPFSKPDGI
jgi:5-methylcytosine-specific restriction endonuclease McrA